MYGLSVFNSNMFRKSIKARKNFERKTQKFIKNLRKSKKKQKSNGSKTVNNSTKTANVNRRNAGNNNTKTANVNRRNTNNNSKIAKAMTTNTGNNNTKTANVNRRNTNNSKIAKAMTMNTVTAKSNKNNTKLVEKDDRACHERFSIKPPRDRVIIREGPQDKDGNPEHKAGKGMVIASATSWERVEGTKPLRMKWGCKYYIKYDGEKEQKLDDIILDPKKKPIAEKYLKKIVSEPVEHEETSKANNNGSNGFKAKNNNGSNSSKAKNTSHEIKNDKGETISEMIKRIKSIQNKLFIERKQKSEKNSDIQKKSSTHPCNIKDLEKEIKELFKVYEKKELIEGEEDEKKLYKYIFLLLHTDKNYCNEVEKNKKMRDLIDEITKLKSEKKRERERE